MFALTSASIWLNSELIYEMKEAQVLLWHYYNVVSYHA